MSSIEFIELANKLAVKYRPDSRESVVRNKHLTGITFKRPPSQEVIDAVLVDFINYMAGINGIDYTLSSSDFPEI